MHFSQRYGYSQARTTIQLKSMDRELRVALWNAASTTFWPLLHPSGIGYNRKYTEVKNSEARELLKYLWIHYFNRPVDEFPSTRSGMHRWIKADFLDSGDSKWYVPYELIEKILSYYPESIKIMAFIDKCNHRLREHMSAYQIVDRIVVPITEQEQIDAIDQALASEQEPVREHLNAALKLLSHKTEPDYANSVNESMRAIESKIKTILAEDKVSVKNGLNKLQSQGKLHPAFAGGFNQLYGFASDVTRHAQRKPEATDQENGKKIVHQEEALFILTLCSTFISYLSAQAARDDHD